MPQENTVYTANAENTVIHAASLTTCSAEFSNTDQAQEALYKKVQSGQTCLLRKRRRWPLPQRNNSSRLAKEGIDLIKYQS
jgi:hypothetical protein